MRLAGSRVLITGAGHGLGLATAAAFVRDGAKVILTDVNSDRIAEARTDSVGTLQRSADTFSMSRSRVISLKSVRESLLKLGPSTFSSTTRGSFTAARSSTLPLERHLATIAVNVSGVVALTHAFLPDLIARPAGHIVNIASAAAVIALPMAATYAASKWAVLGFSESLREELRELGHTHVGITTVCPGYISTGLFDGAKPARLTRWLTPEEVADAVVRAVERGREFVMLPRSVRTMYRLCSGWPRSWYRGICRALGVSRSMAGWRGHLAAGKRWSGVVTGDTIACISPHSRTDSCRGLG